MNSTCDKNEKLTEHEIVAARYIVVVNDSKLNLRTDHPMFGKSFEYKRRNQKAVLQEFLKSLKVTCDKLNEELLLNYEVDIDSKDYMSVIKELDKQINFFVCGVNFKILSDEDAQYRIDETKSKLKDVKLLKRKLK